MKTEDIQALAAEAAKNIKSEQDLHEFKKLLTKMTLETALNAELDDHLKETGSSLAFCRPVNCQGDREGLVLTKFSISDKTAEGHLCGVSGHREAITRTTELGRQETVSQGFSDFHR